MLARHRVGQQPSDEMSAISDDRTRPPDDGGAGGESGDTIVILFLGGDVMTGRGVDQILPHPGDPTLWENHVTNARTYVELAELVNGPIPAPVDFAWPWGDAQQLLDEVAPDLRIVNLETSITRSGDVAVGKGVNYRMNPANIPCLTTARLDACALANNHVLDFGRRGLEDTLDALGRAGLHPVGAGRNADEATAPAILASKSGGHVVVISVGCASSGIPPTWAVAANRPGIDFLPDLSTAAADGIVERVQRAKQPGDVAVVSIHWGSNWGYRVPVDQVEFAHRLVDGGVDLVHGHSSHHPRPIEVYHDRLILYGCGDLIDDYEGISGYERYRDDLRLLWFATLEPTSGAMVELRMAVVQARQMRLRHASSSDREWLREALDAVSRDFGVHVDLDGAGMLALRLP
jgi:poly-gamma-glutamate synthesis protein (capsule biosynthesis protein)